MRSGSVRSCYLMLTVSALLLFAPLLTDAAESLRDPTRPYSPPRRSVPVRAVTFSVTAIFTSQKRRVAIVNRQRVVEGDQVDGATVVEILKDRLRLNLHGKEVTTRLRPGGL